MRGMYFRPTNLTTLEQRALNSVRGAPPKANNNTNEQPWPSTANVQNRDKASVVPWAAAGALKNLALSEGAVFDILMHKDTARCLCRLKKSSDWLESSKSSAALYFLQPRAQGRVDGGFACDGYPHTEPQPTAKSSEGHCASKGKSNSCRQGPAKEEL